LRTVIIDSQILSTFQECGEKYRLSFIENLRSAHVIDPLVKGDVLHTALEGYYRHLKDGLAGEQSRTLLHNQGIEKGIEDARAKAALNGIDLSLAEEVITACEEYFHYYRDDDIVPIYIEEPFIKSLYESPEDDLRVLYAGKIDLVATAARYEWNPTPFDNKSSGRNQTPSGRSNQFFGYTDAIDSSILVVNKVGFQKTLTPAERFRRYNLSYPKEYRARWVENTIKWAYKLVWAIDNNQFEENITSCDKYSGCTFKPICESSTPEAKEWKIQSQFITGDKWDVSRILGLKNDPNEKLILPKTASPSSVELLSANDANERNKAGEGKSGI